jgi:predicted phosphodiesterase
MRLAIISDIHGNGTALKAVLGSITKREEETVDRILCLGDLFNGHGSGEEVIRLLDENNVELIRGNHDDADVPWDAIDKRHHALVQVMLEWDNNNLDSAILNRVAQLPLSITILLDDDRKLCAFHSNPDNLWDMVNSSTITRQQYDAVFAPMEADVLVYGHYHQPHVLSMGGKLLLNPGSVDGTVSFEPDFFARYLIVESFSDRLVLRQACVAYDVAAQEAIDKQTNAPFWQVRAQLKQYGPQQ